MVYIALLSAAGLAAIDQLIKFFAVTWLQDAGTVTLIPGLIDLVYVENTDVYKRQIWSLPIGMLPEGCLTF